MELVPSANEPQHTELQLVLRSRGHVVLYDPCERQVLLRPRALLPEGDWRTALAGVDWGHRGHRADTSVPGALEPARACPTCGRAWTPPSTHLSAHTHGDHILPEPPWTPHDDAAAEDDDDADAEVHAAPQYFRLLSETSAPSSTDAPQADVPVWDEATQGYYERFFIELGRLGRGARGSVYLCQHILHGHCLGKYAVKKIPVGDHSESLLPCLSEVHLMESLNHPNVIHYKHASLTAGVETAQMSAFTPRVPTLHVLMMAANGGSLADWIAARAGDAGDAATPTREHGHPGMRDRHVQRLKAEFRQRRASISRPGRSLDLGSHVGVHLLREDEIVLLLRDVTRGLAFLHGRGVLHLDIKPGNVLLHWDDDALLPTAMLSDFGSSLSLEASWARRRTGHTGTMEYMPPEAVLPDARTGRFSELSSRADIWSLGILFHLLIFFDVPYSQVDDIDTLRSEMDMFQGFRRNIATRGLEKRSRMIDPILTDLLDMMLQRDPGRRPTCEEILLILDSYTNTHADPQAPSGAAPADRAHARPRVRRRSSLRGVLPATAEAHAPSAINTRSHVAAPPDARRALPTYPIARVFPPSRALQCTSLQVLALACMQILAVEAACAWGHLPAWMGPIVSVASTVEVFAW
ncbi:putative serine/threonine-protein kinase iks1 [Malassezia sp. CBS 17886]|nr:putative serine/threonine-protein kinase iks1 [Malassezia sp. CBS 17886]